MANGEEVEKPRPALGGGHCPPEKVEAQGRDDSSGFLGLADVFAIACVVHGRKYPESWGLTLTLAVIVHPRQ